STPISRHLAGRMETSFLSWVLRVFPVLSYNRLVQVSETLFFVKLVKGIVSGGKWRWEMVTLYTNNFYSNPYVDILDLQPRLRVAATGTAAFLHRCGVCVGRRHFSADRQLQDDHARCALKRNSARRRWTRENRARDNKATMFVRFASCPARYPTAPTQTHGCSSRNPCRCCGRRERPGPRRRALPRPTHDCAAAMPGRRPRPAGTASGSCWPRG